MRNENTIHIFIDTIAMTRAKLHIDSVRVHAYNRRNMVQIHKGRLCFIGHSTALVIERRRYDKIFIVWRMAVQAKR